MGGGTSGKGGVGGGVDISQFTAQAGQQADYAQTAGQRPMNLSDAAAEADNGRTAQLAAEWDAGFEDWKKDHPANNSASGSGNQPSAAPAGNQALAAAAQANPAQSGPLSAAASALAWADTPEGQARAAEERAKEEADRRKLERMRSGRSNTLLTTSDGAAGLSDVVRKKLLGE